MSVDSKINCEKKSPDYTNFSLRKFPFETRMSNYVSRYFKFSKDLWFNLLITNFCRLCSYFSKLKVNIYQIQRYTSCYSLNFKAIAHFQILFPSQVFLCCNFSISKNSLKLHFLSWPKTFRQRKIE